MECVAVRSSVSPAAQTVGERARLGAHLKMRNDAESGPATQASALQAPDGNRRLDATHSTVTVH